MYISILMTKFFFNIFNPYTTNVDFINKINKIKLHQNITLNNVINELNKNKIDLKEIPIGLLGKITFTEQSYFKNITFDDIFFITITILSIILIISKNYTFIENKFKFKFSENPTKIFLFIQNKSKFILGFVYIAYSLYMIKLLFNNKQYILINRISFIISYFISGLTLIANLYQ